MVKSINKPTTKTLFLFLVCSALTSCLGYPDSIKPVSNFNVERYTGKWYEIARLDHSFEKGLNQVTAEYTLRNDGGVKVINRGYSKQKQRWEQAEGKAYFVNTSNEGYLKVSFFGPFYGSYVVFELDSDYQYAFVSGPDTDYLWLLARQASISDELKQRFIARVEKSGFSSSDLIWVQHARETN